MSLTSLSSSPSIWTYPLTTSTSTSSTSSQNSSPTSACTSISITSISFSTKSSAGIADITATTLAAKTSVSPISVVSTDEQTSASAPLSTSMLAQMENQTTTTTAPYTGQPNALGAHIGIGISAGAVFIVLCFFAWFRLKSIILRWVRRTQCSSGRIAELDAADIPKAVINTHDHPSETNRFRADSNTLTHPPKNTFDMQTSFIELDVDPPDPKC
ncbi:hypothetical protein F5Y15DRAFT_162877 [Xylariaceae sp. FL0016]|nr:hypothetical protein F5Y15DRAFT_162877 [Xylariaceae sp. FL0016]